MDVLSSEFKKFNINTIIAILSNILKNTEFPESILVDIFNLFLEKIKMSSFKNIGDIVKTFINSDSDVTKYFEYNNREVLKLLRKYKFDQLLIIIDTFVKLPKTHIELRKKEARKRKVYSS